MSSVSNSNNIMKSNERDPRASRLLTPGLDNTRLFLSLTAGAGTRCMSLLSSSPNLNSLSLMCYSLVDE